MSLAPTLLEQVETKVFVYSSDRSVSVQQWKGRLETYAAEAGLPIKCQAISGGSEPSADLNVLTDKPGQNIVLWDVAAHMPPMMLERLLMGLRPRECRAGVRFDAASVARNCALWRRTSGRWTALIRRAAGKVSDPQPPCLAFNGSVAEKFQTFLSGAQVTEWGRALLKTAAHQKYKITEVPVMWSKQ